MPAHPSSALPPIDQKLVEFVRALARQAAREDHAQALLRAAKQKDGG